MSSIGYINENNRTILWSLPPPPPSFLNISLTTPHPGIYILGQIFFSVRNIHVTPLFKRNLCGPVEEFLLGALSVVLIAILSEIVQTILMRTTSISRSTPTRFGLQLAYLVDEIYHFKIFIIHLFRRRTTSAGGRHLLEGSNPSKTRHSITGLTVIAIAAALMAADVFAVYLTQPSKHGSYRPYSYNLRGIQPLSSDHGVSKWVNRLSRERTCVTPAFSDSEQERKYVLSVCFMFSFKKAHEGLMDGVDEVSVTSFYHRGGSDHSVQFGEAEIGLVKRAFVYVTENKKLEREGFADRITFVSNDSKGMEGSKYIHELFIYSAMEFNCNKGNKGPIPNCKELVDEFQRNGGGRHEIVERDVLLWNGRQGDVIEPVKGVKSTYRVSMKNAFQTYDKGIAALTTTSGIEEVEGVKGTYSNITSEEVKDDNVGLLEEEGRVAGVLALVGILVGVIVVLVGLRAVLKPASLGRMAWKSNEEGGKEGGKQGRVVGQSLDGITESGSMMFESLEVGESRIGREIGSNFTDGDRSSRDEEMGEMRKV